MEPRFYVSLRSYMDITSYCVMDDEATARRLPQVYETFRTRESAEACAAQLNGVATYAGIGLSDAPDDWMWHDMKCAHRKFGNERGACDCGIEPKQKTA